MPQGASFVSIVAAWMGLATSVLAAEPPRNVILIGWDGAQREHVEQCLGRGELPSLKRLIDQGKYVRIDVEGTTDTKAGWSQILTGYYPQVTGVYSNARYQPVPKGLSLFERLEDRFGPDDFVTVAVIGKKAHCGEINPPQKIRLDAEQTQPPQRGMRRNAAIVTRQARTGARGTPRGTVIEEEGVRYRMIPGSPYYGMHRALEVWEFGLMENAKVGARALELLNTYRDKPFFFFVHFAEVDHAGHRYGENSKEYNDALISSDLWTGRIMDKVRELGLADKTQFYVTADHGFNEDARMHRFAPYVFLATNNTAVVRDGRRQDVAPTILESFGLDVNTFQPHLDGISLTKPDDRPAAKLEPPLPQSIAVRPQDQLQRQVQQLQDQMSDLNRQMEQAQRTLNQLVKQQSVGQSS
jgi:hypothetical protein